MEEREWGRGRKTVVEKAREKREIDVYGAKELSYREIRQRE